MDRRWTRKHLACEFPIRGIIRSPWLWGSGAPFDRIRATHECLAKRRIMVTAIVLINTAQGLTQEVAQALIGLPGITEAYSVAGSYDLVTIARVRDHEGLADLVSGRV